MPCHGPSKIATGSVAMRLGEISANPPEADHCSSAPAAPASSVTRTSRDEGLRMKRRISNRHRGMPDTTAHGNAGACVRVRVRSARCEGERRSVSRSSGCRHCAGVWLTAQPAFAQDSFRQTVVVTAAARPVELGSVARRMTIITREQIARLPVQSVADVLRLAASIDVRMRGVARRAERLRRARRELRADARARRWRAAERRAVRPSQRRHPGSARRRGAHRGPVRTGLVALRRRRVRRHRQRDHAPHRGAAVARRRGRELRHGRRPRAGRVRARRVSARRCRGSVDRSSGFMYDRDFKTTIVRSRTSLGDSTGVSFSHLWKEFGANNFYGGNAPSREWTNQTLVAADHRFRRDRPAGARRAVASYRTHGDRFLFNQLQPQLSDNRHRTHAVLAAISGARRVGGAGTLTVGVEGGGDWIRSTNLGDHSTARVSGFGEWRQDIGRTRAARRHHSRRSLQRVRHVVEPVSRASGGGRHRRFVCGRRRRARSACRRSPSATTRTRRTWRARRSVPRPRGRVRVARTCSSPADGSLQATMFGRADENVIDWLRPTTADRWRTYNIRDVDTRGVELGIRKTFASGPMVLAEYTALDVDAAAVDQLSKYVLDYAPHSFVAAAVIPLPGRIQRRAARSSTVAARAPRARSTTSCSMRASAVASGSTSNCSWTDATCSTRAIRKSPASRCRAPRCLSRWRSVVR